MGITYVFLLRSKRFECFSSLHLKIVVDDEVFCWKEDLFLSVFTRLGFAKRCKTHIGCSFCLDGTFKHQREERHSNCRIEYQIIQLCKYSHTLHSVFSCKQTQTMHAPLSKFKKHKQLNKRKGDRVRGSWKTTLESENFFLYFR